MLPQQVTPSRTNVDLVARLPRDAFSAICDMCDAQSLTRLGMTSVRVARYLSLLQEASATHSSPSESATQGQRYPWGIRLRRTVVGQRNRDVVAHIAIEDAWPGWTAASLPSPPQLAFTTKAVAAQAVRHAAVYFEERARRVEGGTQLEHKLWDEDDDAYYAAPAARTTELVARLEREFESRARSAMSLHHVTTDTGDSTDAAHSGAQENAGATPSRRSSCITFPLSPQLYTGNELDTLAFLVAHSTITRHQVHESDHDHKRALIARLTGPTLGTVEVRFFAMLRMGSFPCFRSALVWLPGSFGQGDILSDRFQADITEPRELFAAGFGRVEMDIRPRLSADEMGKLRAHLLPDMPDYPLELLWNAIAIAVLGDALDAHHASFEFQYRDTVLGCVARGFALRGTQPEVTAVAAVLPPPENPPADVDQPSTQADGGDDEDSDATPSSEPTLPSLTSSSSDIDLDQWSV